jgi:hypothetical protein
VSDCLVEKKFFGTAAIRAHLSSHHDISEPHDDDQNEDQDKVNETMDQNKHKATNELLLNFVISNYLPFNIVENMYFKRFIKSVFKSYKLPCRKTLSNTTLDKAYTSTITKFKKDIAGTNNVSLTTDAWTSLQNVSYLSLTIHFLDDKFNPKTHTLALQEFYVVHQESFD